MKDKAQMEELVSGLISEATKVTHGQASLQTDGQSQRSARVRGRPAPEYPLALP